MWTLYTALLGFVSGILVSRVFIWVLSAYANRCMRIATPDSEPATVPDALQLHALWDHYGARVGPDASDLEPDTDSYVILVSVWRDGTVTVRRMRGAP